MALDIPMLIEKNKRALITNRSSAINSDALKECAKDLRSLSLALKRSKTVGSKNKISSAITSLKSFRTKHKSNHPSTSAGRNINRKQWASNQIKWEDTASAFQNRIRTGIITNIKHKEPLDFLKDCTPTFRRRVKNVLKKYTSLKVNAIFCGEFKIVKPDAEILEYKYMNTKNESIFANTNLDDWFRTNVQVPVLREIEEFEEKDSGWTLSCIVNLSININKYTPQLVGSFIELPEQIKNKKACINVKNNDNACFAWAVISALYPVTKNSDRMSSYPNYREHLNLTGITFPMPLRQIPNFEEQNGISINVYILQLQKKDFVTLPYYLTNNKKDKHINLLLIEANYKKERGTINLHTGVKTHYVWIKSLSKLLYSQVSRSRVKKYFCDRCLHYFYSAAKLEQHTEDCRLLNKTKIILPTQENKYLKFKNFKRKVKAPFVIYADLECLLEGCNDGKKFQKHVPCNIGFYVHCTYDPTLSRFRARRNEDCVKWFTNELNQFAQELENIFRNPLPMDKLTTEQFRNFRTAKVCHICELPFTKDDKKVRDHCHLTGKYRGAAHDGCNMNFKNSQTIPIVFHNLSGYDSHFIIKNIALDFDGRVQLLPINNERYISFTKHVPQYKIKYRFIDSFKFMASSLDKLSSYLTSFPILKSQFSDLSDDKFELLTRKGVYPYDYFDQMSKFSETCLPDKSKFYNKLNDCDVKEKDYARACDLWNNFSLRNLGEYSDLYLKTDVLLLADVFEQFRDNCCQYYDLDPAHYFTLPGFTWEAMLKYTKISLELLTDIDMLMFFERGIRGGLSQCSKRYAKANNKYVDDFDSTKPSKYLMYLDINNQYGWAMSQPLPYGGFQWADTASDFDVNDIADDSPIGFILEVDLEYPEELHDLHRDLPFCPEHDNAPESTQKKLLATLRSKSKYIIHYRSLKQALHHGLRLSIIHRVLQFNQSTWLKPYIDLNTKYRASAKNKFEENLFKLMNNAVFGKTMENVRKHRIVKLASNWSGRYNAEALISKPQFKSVTIFDENLVSIELNKLQIFFNKPIYIGMCVLDLAKTTIYDFHYGYMLPQFESNCSICYTDTDSLIYEVQCADLYGIIKRDCRTRFDTSGYPIDNVWGIPCENKMVLGLMKDEHKGNIMTEFVGLRAKMYAVQVKEEKGTTTTKKSKGVKINVVEKEITFRDYVECLTENKNKTLPQNRIQSKNHQVSTVKQPKIALSPHDDKRFLLPNSYDTLPWGHYRTK